MTDDPHRPPPFQINLRLLLVVTFTVAVMLGVMRSTNGVLAVAVPVQIGLVVSLLYLTWRGPPTGIILGSVFGLMAGLMLLSKTSLSTSPPVAVDLSLLAAYAFLMCAAIGGGIHAVFLEHDFIGWIAIVFSVFGCCSGAWGMLF